MFEIALKFAHIHISMQYMYILTYIRIHTHTHTYIHTQRHTYMEKFMKNYSAILVFTGD